MSACELQNFSEAARQLHISQSTLSHQIKQLEDELDILLFDRIGKRVIPTEAGNAFLPFARKSIQDAENGRQIIRDLKGIETGILHIGATYSLSPLLISAMKLFAKTYPGIKVLLTLATSAELIDLLKDNSLDFILSFDAEEWPNEKYTTATLTLDELLAERGREFIFEGKRRTDLIRFGKFLTESWWDHTPTTSEHLKIFPIPYDQTSLNPNLVQNEGY